ncbi:hypothetical protein GUITHDRAFT_109137 [Guillardia theta CCMP2712]|uniref:ditrans,polycis-polyprenyl diphosphate synthase [(2E,6E)-farnesyldiphosphate specific] n=1 Tax=Guillardia theta (strain CCMP2712) TaxID=905079 RepID=L1J9S5_GUITC|nr:hypothetical protein GUITHDRAFT_109137 [Guillardia theta CCMP2712]EKX45092.1 hypothetical protein GUITHDRAFT_109137 [Guillardia theta CCMP2712]|eukprot:XP_005832072.1 hypothetical protein GUITHDRAFT_109137 [Guillardia theta CCMP2712]
MKSIKSLLCWVTSLALYPGALSILKLWVAVHVIFELQKRAMFLRSAKGPFLQVTSTSSSCQQALADDSFGSLPAGDVGKGGRTAGHVLLALNDASFTLPRHVEHEMVKLKSCIRWAFASGARIISVYNMHGWLEGAKESLMTALQEEDFGITTVLIGENGRPVGWIRGGTFREGRWDAKNGEECGAIFFDDLDSGKQRLIQCARELCQDVKESKEPCQRVGNQIDPGIPLVTNACGAQINADFAQDIFESGRASAVGCLDTPPSATSCSCSVRLPEPEMAISFGPAFILPDYNPWQTRLTEFFEGGELKRVKLADLEAILLRFSSSEVRVGK